MIVIGYTTTILSNILLLYSLIVLFCFHNNAAVIVVQSFTSSSSLCSFISTTSTTTSHHHRDYHRDRIISSPPQNLKGDIINRKQEYYFQTTCNRNYQKRLQKGLLLSSINPNDHQQQEQHHSRKEEEQLLKTNDEKDDWKIQWELFQKYHAPNDIYTSWKGIWTTYNYIGDVELETVASVNYNKKKKQNKEIELLSTTDKDNDDNNIMIEHTHTIVIGATQSDCNTCYDSMEMKDIPIAIYSKPNDIFKKMRLGACGLVMGPTVLRNGVMATELVLSHQDGRIRIVYQYAPVWEKDIEPGSCPPQGLKLFRILVSKEVLRETPTTYQSEQSSDNNIGSDSNSISFYRSIPPYKWHKKWSGTSWTWGIQAGNRGWKIDELDANSDDAWHGISPPSLWNLRIPGGIYIQCPRVITQSLLTSTEYDTTESTSALFRFAWLPNDETLLRLEVGIVASKPLIDNDGDMIGFQPPKLISYRCDMLNNGGELENQPTFKWPEEEEVGEVDDSSSAFQ